jgi:HK97 family phage portal protein
MRPIHPSRVTILQQDDNSLRYRVTQPNGQGELVLGEKDVLHIRGLGDDGISGYSVARVAAESLGLSLAAQNFGASFFGNATMPCGVLTVPEALKDQAFKHLRESWAAHYGGSNKAGAPAILEQGMKWERMSIPPEEAQFIETRQFAIEDVARWFRMPPHKLQHLLRTSYASAEQMSIEYVVDTLLPWMVRWEQSIKQKLLAAKGEEELFVKHTVQGLLRGDQAARSAFYSSRFQNGSMSQNDIRELEDENPIGPDGDVYYVPSNLTRSEDAAQGKVASAAGTQGPGFPPRAPGDDNEEDEDAETDEGEEPEDESEPEPPTKSSSLASTLAPIWEDVAARILRKEIRAVARAATKYEGIPAGWHGWLDDFYAELSRDIEEMATPGALAASAADGLSRQDALSIVHEMAESYVIESRLLLARAGAGSQVELVMTRWIPERQNQIAARFNSRFTTHAEREVPCST